MYVMEEEKEDRLSGEYYRCVSVPGEGYFIIH